MADPDSDEWSPLTQVSGMQVKRGTRVRNRTPGGGGWGPPPARLVPPVQSFGCGTHESITTMNTVLTRTVSLRPAGADIGGTFTDIALIHAGRLLVGKRLTIHGSEADGIIQALADAEVPLTDARTVLAHGHTLAIDALLERKGAHTAS